MLETRAAKYFGEMEKSDYAGKKRGRISRKRLAQVFSNTRKIY
eukprot:UN20172